jgi:hypothetical protein
MKKFLISLGLLIVIVSPLSIVAKESAARTTEGTVGFTGTFPSKEKPTVSPSQNEIIPLGNKELPKTGARDSPLGWIGLSLLNLMVGLIYLKRSK